MSSFQFLKRGAAISILAALLCSAPAAAAASRGGSQASLQSRPMTNSILSIRERNEHALSSHPPTTHSKKNGIIGRKTDILRGGNGKADSNNALVQALAGTVVFAAIEKAVKLGLQAANVQYPAQLGACILLFAFMALLDVASPAAAQGLFVFLSPGAALLAKWFPVLFVPGLAMLPLSPSIGGTVDVSV